MVWNGDPGATWTTRAHAEPRAAHSPRQSFHGAGRSFALNAPAGTAGWLFALAEVFQDALERFDHFFARDAALGEAQFQIEQLRWRTVREHEVLRPAGFRFGRSLADLLPRGAPLGGNFLDRAVIFSGVSCLTTCNNNDLDEMSASRQRFRTSSGIWTARRDSVADVRDFPRRRARSSCVWPQRSARPCRASASSNGVRSLPAGSSISATSSTWVSSASRTTTGDYAQARPVTIPGYRRSPAISVSLAAEAAASGSITPFSAIEAISSDRSPMTWRG